MKNWILSGALAVPLLALAACDGGEEDVADPMELPERVVEPGEVVNTPPPGREVPADPAPRGEPVRPSSPTGSAHPPVPPTPPPAEPPSGGTPNP